jgi:hypothetical protein
VGAEQVAELDRGRIPVSRGMASLQRPRQVSFFVLPYTKRAPMLHRVYRALCVSLLFTCIALFGCERSASKANKQSTDAKTTAETKKEKASGSDKKSNELQNVLENDQSAKTPTPADEAAEVKAVQTVERLGGKVRHLVIT